MSLRSMREQSISYRANRWWSMTLLSGLLIAIMPLSAQAASEAQVVINASGGNAGDPGLRIHYANGEIQVFRRGVPQLFEGLEPSPSPNGTLYNAIALNLEGLAYTPVAYMVPGASFSQTTQAGGSASGSGTITGTLDTGVVGFLANVTINYVYPNEYFNVTIAIDRGLTTVPLKLYHFGIPHSDMWLSPGLYIDSPRTVGISASGTFQAFRQVSGSAWTAHISDWYSLSWNQVGNGLDFSNSINTGSGSIKSFGVVWDLGTAPGSQTVSYEMVFSDAPLPLPAQMAAPTGVVGDSSVTVSIAAPADNGSAITGYTVTSAPGGVTCSSRRATVRVWWPA
jgi:hypothetical protein